MKLYRILLTHSFIVYQTSSQSQTSTGLSWKTAFSLLCTSSLLTPFFRITCRKPPPPAPQTRRPSIRSLIVPSVAGGHDLFHGKHMTAPSEVSVFLHSAAYQLQNLASRPKMNEFRRGQAQKLQPVSPKCLPYFSARLKQFFTELPSGFSL